MAAVKIADVIVPEVFNPYLIETTNRLDAFVQSGIIQHDAHFDVLASQGGKIIEMPYWTDLTASGDDEILDDSTPLLINKIGSNKDRARLIMRGKAWGVNDLAVSLSGDDPMGAIAQQVSKYWIGKRSKVLFAILKGIFAGASLDANKHDITGVTNGQEITASGTLDAKQLFGENSDKLVAIAMHSKVHTHLQKQGLIEDQVDLKTGEKYQTYLGYRVIVDDQCETDNTYYKTYLFGYGAFALGNGTPEVPTETDRDSLAGEDVLINRQHYVLHPRGVAWQEVSCAGSSPTNTELETATNWSAVFDLKNIRIVEFKHHLTNTP